MNDKTTCNLILDSCCDLPRNIVDNAGVTFLRFPFNMNDGEHLDDLWQSMGSKDFYDRLRGGETSSTSQVPMHTLSETFEKAAAAGVPTVYLGFTGGLSGTFETAERVAADVRATHPGFELYLVDTMLASVPEGLLVHEAIRQRDRGLSARQLAEWAEEARWFVYTLFTLDGLEHLRRGGRIPDAAAYAGAKLNIKPLLDFNLDGSLAFAGAARGRKRSLKALVAAYKDNAHVIEGVSDMVMVGSADAAHDAQWVAEHLDRPETSLPPLMCEIGPVIGSHVGPGMVCITFWGPDRRKTASIADRIASKFSKE